MVVTAGSRGEKYQVFFRQFVRDAKEQGFEPFKGGEEKNYRHFRTARTGFSYSVSFSKDGFRVELAMESSREKNRKAFDAFKGEKTGIEDKLGKLMWDRDGRTGDRIACRIYARRDGSIDDSPSKLSELNDWTLRMLPWFRDVFDPRLKKFGD
jgi:hypothetical protein